MKSVNVDLSNMPDNEITILPEKDEGAFEIRTICGECVFSVYDDENIHQTGCILNRLDKFIELKKAIYQTKDDINSYEIQGLCNTCRTEEWLQSQEGDPVQKVISETNVKLDFFLLIESNENLEEQINKTLSSIKAQKYYPVCIHIGLSPQIKSKDVSIIKKSLLEIVPNFKYLITSVIKDYKDKRDIIDFIQIKSKSHYYTVIEVGEEIPESWLEKINYTINEKLDNFLFIRPLSENSLTGMTIQNLLHRTIVGSRGQLIEDKITVLATDQNSLHKIKTWEEINA